MSDKIFPFRELHPPGQGGRRRVYNELALNNEIAVITSISALDGRYVRVRATLLLGEKIDVEILDPRLAQRILSRADSVPFVAFFYVDSAGTWWVDYAPRVFVDAAFG